MKAVVLFSGGLDSSVLVYDLLSQGCEVVGLTVEYGQKHAVSELIASSAIAKLTGIEHVIVDLEGCYGLFAGSALTSPDIDIPAGHYEDKVMACTVVPNRNMVLLSLATACAISRGAVMVGYAAHAGDRAIYPDCRSEFADAMDGALALCSDNPITLYRPYVAMSKADIVNHGHSLYVPMEKTYSCYRGASVHCGECATCIERREAFILAGVSDETEYLHSDEIKFARK